VANFLVLDNDRAMRELIGLVLKRAGFMALPAASLEDAEDWLASAQVDAMLLDLHLGGGHSGVSVVHRWRAKSFLAPFLVVTGTPDDPSLAELEGEPLCGGVVAKPFSIDELSRRAAALLES